MGRALPPFAFYARLLGPRGGRRAFLARLGPEAGDALDEFLNLALAHERARAPVARGVSRRSRSAGRVDQARHGCVRRLCAGDDRPCRQGAGRQDRVPARCLRRAGRQSRRQAFSCRGAQWRGSCWSGRRTRTPTAPSSRRLGQIAAEKRRRGISPPALCRHDPRRRTADHRRPSRQARGFAGKLARDDRSRRCWTFATRRRRLGAARTWSCASAPPETRRQRRRASRRRR